MLGLTLHIDILKIISSSTWYFLAVYSLRAELSCLLQMKKKYSNVFIAIMQSFLSLFNTDFKCYSTYECILVGWFCQSIAAQSIAILPAISLSQHSYFRLIVKLWYFNILYHSFSSILLSCRTVNSIIYHLYLEWRFQAYLPWCCNLLHWKVLQDLIIIFFA